MNMNRIEIEQLISNTVEKLQKTHSQLISGINIQELKDYSLTLAFTESKFNEKAKNPNSTAKGLFQILDGTRRDIEKRIMKIPQSPYDDIWKPEYNAYLGIGYFAFQYKRYQNDWTKGVIAYNLGSWKGQTSTAYSTKFYKHYNELFALAGSNNSNVKTINLIPKGFK